MKRAWNLSENGWRLDVLRGVAILAVVSVHASQVLPSYQGEFRALLSLGAYGVELFFFLSGFLMSALYDAAPSKGFAKRYWSRRMARIFPLWAFFSIASYLAYRFSPSSWILQAEAYSALEDQFIKTGSLIHNPTTAIVLTILFLGFLSPMLWNATVAGGWSIQSEVFHYLFYFVFRRHDILPLVAVALLGLFSWVYAVAVPMHDGNLYGPGQALLRLSPFSTLMFFVGGVMFRRLGSDVERPHARWLVPSFLLVSSWPAVSLALPFGSFAYGVMFVTLAVIAVALMAQGLASKLLAFFGRYSYFAYFFHFFVLELWARYLEQGFQLLVADWGFPPSLDYLVTFVVAFSFATSVTYLVAPVSRAFLERPIMEWARRLSP